MESSTRNRIARVSIATVAVALAATTLASAAPSLDLSLPGSANRLCGGGPLAALFAAAPFDPATVRAQPGSSASPTRPT